jgi:ribosomal protein S18 acetylase RimI-like enzyme
VQSNLLSIAVGMTNSEREGDVSSSMVVERLESLPRDLPAVIQRFLGQPVESVASAEANTASDFPGIVVIDPDRIIAFAGFGLEGDGNVSLTPPQLFSRDQSASCQQVVSMVVKEAVREAQRLGGVRLRCLLPDTFDREMQQRLVDSGFAVLNRIGRWTRSMELTPNAFASVDKLIPSRRLNATGDEELEGLLSPLLKRILEDSNDLRQLPSPDVKGLIADWIEKKCQFYLAGEKGPGIGLAVVSLQPAARPPDAQPPAGKAQPGCEFALEYIGVHPEHRRQSVAAALLGSILKNAAGSSTQHDVPERIAAFVDDRNEAAVKWYLRMGFLKESTATLLVHELSASGTADGQ